MTQIIHKDVGTLGDLVGCHPELIHLCDEKQIDFCCGGDRSITEICRARGWDADDFLAEVRARIKSGEDGPVPTFETGQVAPLIDYILDRFHAGHRRDFEALVQMAGKVWEVHGAKWPRMGVLSQLIDHLIKDICPHMLKEEQILFPMMLTQDQGRQGPVMCPSGGPAGPIAVMRKEHENVGELLASLAVVTDQFTPPTWACPTFRSMFALLKQLSEEIRLHVHLENNVLFPMAAKGKSNVPGG